MKKLILAIAFALLLASPVLAGGKSTRLQYKLMPGQVVKHKLSAEIEMASLKSGKNAMKPIKMTLVGMIRTKLITVFANGTAKISVSMDNLEVTSPTYSDSFNLPSRSAELIVDRTGKVLNVPGNVAKKAPDLLSLAGQLGALLPIPDRKLQQGDRWENRTPMPGKGCYIRSNNRLSEADTVVNGRVVAKIDRTYNGKLDLAAGAILSGVKPANAQSGSATLSGKGITLFSKMKGKALKATDTVEIISRPTSGPATKMKIKATITAV